MFITYRPARLLIFFILIALILFVCFYQVAIVQMPSQVLSQVSNFTSEVDHRDCEPKLHAEIIVLVIATDNTVYSVNWAVWYRLKDQSNKIQTYFVRANRSVSGLGINEVQNTITVPTNESYIPGILISTIEAVRALLNDSRRTFTYILRTNLSSLWHWDRLFAALKVMQLPATGVYAGVLGGGFVSGAGMLLSRDVAQALVNHSHALHFDLFDDVAIGQLMASINISETALPRCDYVNNQLPFPLDKGTCFHYRVKNADRIKYDHYILSRLYFEIFPTPLRLTTRARSACSTTP